jgi:transposase
MRGASAGRVTFAAHLLNEKGGPKRCCTQRSIHKRTFHAAVLDVESGEISERRLGATREELNDWAMPLQGRLAAVAIEATTGWRWVWRELSALGFEVRLVDPAQAKALRGRTRRAKTDRLDARWLCLLLAKAMLPESWLPPTEIQQLRDRTRLRKALAEDRTRWAQRLHALLTHEGWSCQRARLLTVAGRRWAAALVLSPPARAQVDCLLRVIEAVESELRPLEAELRRFARTDRRCRALQTIYGVGPILACHLLAELGEAARFRRPRQAVRAAGLDPVVDESGESRRRGRLAKHGAPALRWALVEAAQHARRTNSPDRGLHAQAAQRVGGKRAVLTVARKIGRRAYHVLRELEAQAA